MKNNAIRQAIEHHVDGLRLSEEAVHAILQKAREGCPVKRKTSLMLVAVIVLLLGAATALAVTALHGLGFVGREMDGSVYSGTTDGQRLYYSDGFSLMVWQPENETPQVLISGKSWREAGLSTPGTRPVHTGETLLLMDNETKKIWRWTGEDLAPVLNYAGTPLDALAQNIRALFWQDGALYLVCGDTTSSTMYLVRADIADGSAQALALEGYVHLSSYRDGLLLGIRGAEGGNQAVLLDAATGEVQEALGTPADLRGICWAQERGTFYAMVDGMLARWDGTDWQSIRACALPAVVSFRGVLGDWYVAAGVEGIRLIALDGPEEAQTLLTIRGLPSLEMNLDHSFQQAYPGTVISRRTETNHFCARDAVEAIRAGDTTDLFYLRLDGELLGLLREGFFPAIGSDALLAEAEGMAPIFRNVLVWDGQLLACAGAPAVMAWQAAEGAKPPPPTLAELAASHLMPWTREQYVRCLLTQLLMEEGDLPSEALAPALEALGAGWLTLHPRTAKQGFTGTARWEYLSELKALVSLPVIASGDLFTAEDGVRCLAETGVDTVMYARGALRDPAIFKAHLDLLAGREPEVADVATLLARIREHARLARELSTEKVALLKMRTIVPRYVRHIEGSKQLRADIIACRSWDDFEKALRSFEAGKSSSE